MRRRAVLLLLILMLLLTGCNSSDYKKADMLYNGGSYEAALTIFRKLGTYKDSADRMTACMGMLAAETFAAGKYKESYIWYSQLLGNAEYAETATEHLYKIGKASMESQDWSLAANCFSKIPGYENSQELLRRSKGMKAGSNFADSAFLEDASSAALARVYASADNEKRKLVIMEQGFIEKYRTRDFYDSALKNLAIRYSDSLRQELSILNLTGTALQIAWQRAEVERYDVLRRLYEDFYLCSDSTPFVSCYIDGYETMQTALDGMIAIDADIQSQIDNGEISVKMDSAGITLTLQNRTEYAFSMKTVFTFSYKVKGADKVLETVEAVVRDIKPGETYRVTAKRSSKSASATDWDFSTEYMDVTLG